MERFVRALYRRGHSLASVLGILAFRCSLTFSVRKPAQSDNRNLAPSAGPSWNMARALSSWPREADAYLKDHFGFRAQLIGGVQRLQLARSWDSTDPRVIVGRNGRSSFRRMKRATLVLLSDCGAWWPEKHRIKVCGGGAVRPYVACRPTFPALGVLIVPTSDLVYPADLPESVSARLRGKTPLVKDWLRLLPPDVRDVIAYPIEAATHLPPDAPLIPEHNFHWSGRGVSLFMEAYAEDQFHFDRQIAPVWKSAVEPADLERFLPGAGLSNEVQVPVWPPSVRVCGRTIAFTLNRSAVSPCRERRSVSVGIARVHASCCSATVSDGARLRSH